MNIVKTEGKDLAKAVTVKVRVETSDRWQRPGYNTIGQPQLG